jgi:hypothetical protein
MVTGDVCSEVLSKWRSETTDEISLVYLCEDENGKFVGRRCSSCGKTYVYRGCYCGDRFTCKYCRKKRIRKLATKYLPVLKSFRWPALVTLTMKREAGEGIKEGKKRLDEGFRELRRLKVWNPVRHYFGSYEFGENHLHIHLMVDCVWIDQKALSEAWNRITGNPVVDVRRVRNPEKAIKEVFKYIVKDEGPHGVSDEFIDQARAELKGVRLVVASKGLSSLDTTEISGQFTCPECGRKLELIGVFDNVESMLEVLFERRLMDEVYVKKKGKWKKVEFFDYRNGWVCGVC